MFRFNLFRFMAFAFFLSVTGAFALDYSAILSPMPGKWKNTQALVIDCSESGGIYYSLSGSDPLVSGFAYDGPVVLEQKGDVKLHITFVGKGKGRQDFEIQYSVESQSDFSNEFSKEDAEFLSGISSSPIRKYTSGGVFSIPRSFKYSFKNEDEPEFYGRELSLDEGNLLERYMPCTVKDSKGGMWHFVLHTQASKKRLTSFEEKDYPKELPYSLTNWSNFYYTGDDLIYQIDDSYWSGVRQTIILDRSVPHTVRFQSVAFEVGNPVTTYIIPPMPQLKKQSDENGREVYSIDESFEGIPFLIGPSKESLSSLQVARGFYKEIYADTFFGDEVKEDFLAGIYYDGVYQGSVKVSCSLDKLPPKPPVISSPDNSSRARSKMRVQIQAEEGDIFYSVSEPVVSAEGFSAADISKFDTVLQSDFVPYGGNMIELDSVGDSATFYKVLAYSQDEKGNRSSIGEYRVVLAESNFYLGKNSLLEKSSSENSIFDGSYEHPFSSFEQAAQALNSTEKAVLHIEGRVLCKDEVTLKSSCVISGYNAEILFEENGSLKFEDADVVVKDLVIRKIGSSKADDFCVKVQNSKVKFEGCEIVGVFKGRGILVQTDDSSVYFEGTGLTCNAAKYSSCLSASSSQVEFVKSRITSSALDSINLSIHGGNIKIFSSAFKTIANLGCAIELVETEAFVDDNVFAASLSSKTQKQGALWKDADSVVKQNKENRFEGWK